MVLVTMRHPRVVRVAGIEPAWTATVSTTYKVEPIHPRDLPVIQY